MNEIAKRLHELHGLRKPVPGIGGQQLGLEQYRIVASGQTWEVLIEAAELIERLESECHPKFNGSEK